ncbi:hypothetical protein, conserved [Plasmodium gonderi]|uniref:Uncharacterized protein n=1 Tax=Plasmodium gonderi TaxID=77519 RepID=A0A1Y1JS68_PLAGO|nr:hypothetical protein, conserved [Plasmodium gonderi]GAW83652.1 hypothetical protein, conserved [Plasmodium gonderi]
MNQVSVKSKLKTTEFISSQNRGVRFMNKDKNHLSTVSKNVAYNEGENVTTGANSHNPTFTHKIAFAKNSHLKPRTNNHPFKHTPKSSLKNNQKGSYNVSRVDFSKFNHNANSKHDNINNSNEDDNNNGGSRVGGKKTPHLNATNFTNEDSRKSYLNRLMARNQRSSNKYYNSNMNVHTNLNASGENGNLRAIANSAAANDDSNSNNINNGNNNRNGNNINNGNNNRNGNNINNSNNNRNSNNINNSNSNNHKNSQQRLCNQPYNYESEEILNHEYENAHKSEEFIYSYASPIKRKYDAIEKNINKGIVPREGGGGGGGGRHIGENGSDPDNHNVKVPVREYENGRRETKIQNKRFVPRGYRHDNSNLQYGNHFNMMDTSNGANEKTNCYGNMILHSNENILSSNHTTGGGVGLARVSLANLNSSNSNLYGINQEDTMMSRMIQPQSGVEVVGSGNTMNNGVVEIKKGVNGSNWAKGANNAIDAIDGIEADEMDQMDQIDETDMTKRMNRASVANVMMGENCEDNLRVSVAEKNYKNIERQKRNENNTLVAPNQNYQHQNFNNSLYYLRDSTRFNRRSIRNTNYITDTNSEKMMNNTMSNHNDLFHSCTFEKHSEENFNSYVKKKKSDIRNGSTMSSLMYNLDKESLVYNNATRYIASNSSSKFSRLLKNNFIESKKADLCNFSIPVPYLEGQKFASSSNNGVSCFERMMGSKMPIGMNESEARNMRSLNLQKEDILESNIDDSEHNFYRKIVHNITNCNNDANDIDVLYKNVININNYALNFDKENEYISEIVNITNSINENVRNIQQIVLNKKKVIQDKRNLINEEYEIISQKLKECESIFCDSDGNTNGEKKLKVFYEIDEKKNILKNKYEVKKMLLKKAEYKIEKLQEYTDAVKLKTLAISERYKKTFLLIEELFRLKIIKDNENELEVCLIPKNTKMNMWHKLQLDKREMTPDTCDYLWNQIESFVDKDALSNYL